MPSMAGKFEIRSRSVRSVGYLRQTVWVVICLCFLFKTNLTNLRVCFQPLWLCDCLCLLPPIGALFHDLSNCCGEYNFIITERINNQRYTNTTKVVINCSILLMCIFWWFHFWGFSLWWFCTTLVPNFLSSLQHFAVLVGVQRCWSGGGVGGAVGMTGVILWWACPGKRVIASKGIRPPRARLRPTRGRARLLGEST